jgi:hypothetical protein
MVKIGLGIAIAAFLGAAAEQTWIDEYQTVSAAANRACGARDYPECRRQLSRMSELLDGRADIVYRLAKVEMAAGNPDAALELLSLFSKSGLTFVAPEKDADFAPLHERPEWAEVVSRIAEARKNMTASEPFVTLAQQDLVAEDIAYDPRSARFFVSSVRHGKIVAFGKDGAASDFLPEGRAGVWAVLALGVDARRRLLWASTASMPEFARYEKAQDGRSALLKISLDTGKILKRYDTPSTQKHALGDLTVSRAGDVYVSDGYGTVYLVDHQRDTLDVLVGPGTFRSPQTPALSPDQTRLFVADFTRGIGIVNLKTRAVALLPHPPEMSLGGIDGLYLSGRLLIAMQNGTTPRRVIRMELDAGLTRVVGWKILEANWEGLGDPTHGVVVGGDLYFIVNSGWDKLADDGSVKGELTSPAVRRMKLGQ